MRRRGRPGLVGTMARTAVVAGTATAVSGNVARRQAGRAEAKQQEQYDIEAAQYGEIHQNQQLQESQAQIASMQAQLAAQQSQQAAAPAADDLTSKLKQLAELRAAGILDDAEFSAAKAKLLSA
jgi:hypothetical protein